MHKKYSLSHLRLVLSEVVLIGIETLRELHKDLNTVALDTTDPKEIARYQSLTATIILITNVIHPGLSTARTLFDGIGPIIDRCEMDYKTSVDKKYLSGTCKCSSCTLGRIG